MFNKQADMGSTVSPGSPCSYSPNSILPLPIFIHVGKAILCLQQLKFEPLIARTLC